MGKHIGIIDLGSNSARLVVYHCDDQGMAVEYDNIKRVLRLSSHLRKDGTIDKEGFQKTIACLKLFKELCDARAVSEITAVATAAIRQAVNGQALLDQIEKETGIRVRLLSGEQEAHYGYLAVVNTMKIDHAIIVDIGGGSTEISYIQDRKRMASYSFPFGAVTLTENFLLHETPSKDELRALHDFLRKQFSSQPWIANRPCPLVAIGGTARNLAKMHQQQKGYSLSSLHHYIMERSEVEAMFSWISGQSVEARKNIQGLSKDRADIIVAGLAVFCSLMEYMDNRILITSNKGLRDGLLFEKMLQTQNKSLIEDVPLFSAEQFMNRYKVNKPHAYHVRNLAVSLFDDFNRLGLFTFNETERKLLEIASLLHDIGRSINVYETSRHTFYLLSNVLLMGLTHRERLLIAMIASYKNNKQMQGQMVLHKDIVSKSDEEIIQKLGLLLLLARTLDRSMTQQITSVTIKEKKKEWILECTGTKDSLIEYSLINDILEKTAKLFKRKFILSVKRGDSVESTGTGEEKHHANPQQVSG